MPHDAKGLPIIAGDQVVIRARVDQVYPADQYCNVTLHLPPMPPRTEPYILTLNTRQVERVNPE